MLLVSVKENFTHFVEAMETTRSQLAE